MSLFPKRQIVDQSKLKDFADDNFEFLKLASLQRVENTVGRGEMLVMSNFSFSYSVCKRLVLQTRKKNGLFGKELRE